MTRPLSNDLRVRLVGAVAGGLSCRAAADRYGVAASTAVKWVRRWCGNGLARRRYHRPRIFATTTQMIGHIQHLDCA